MSLEDTFSANEEENEAADALNRRFKINQPSFADLSYSAKKGDLKGLIESGDVALIDDDNLSFFVEESIAKCIAIKTDDAQNLCETGYEFLAAAVRAETIDEDHAIEIINNVCDDANVDAALTRLKCWLDASVLTTEAAPEL